VTAAAPPDPPVLELDRVDASYRQFRALFGVSLRVRKAQAVALVGPNGAGKTTVARVASGLLVPTAGQVSVDGRNMTGRPAQEFALVGVVHAPEGRSVFASLDVEENLMLPFRRQFGRSGLKAALTRAYDMFPRLGERRHQNAGSLSGGEQRMLSLARSVMLEPRLLIADELSLGLAPIVTTELYRVLERLLAAGTALLIIEQHASRALALADELIVFERGRVTFTGSPREVEALGAFLPDPDPGPDPAPEPEDP
jgi:branched-chain amino acid transport system ATP-binding protein